MLSNLRTTTIFKESFSKASLFFCPAKLKPFASLLVKTYFKILLVLAVIVSPPNVDKNCKIIKKN